MTTATTLTVSLGERSYPIHVVDDGVGGLGAAMAAELAPGPVAVVTNPVVGAHYLEPTLGSLRAAGFEPHVAEVPDGEVHKTVATWHALVESLLSAGMQRTTPVVALGGGVTGDIAGFAAASVLRGVPVVQVPTSLLAMVDSSVGGKTGVNSPRGKNLIGAFHQPRMVYVPVRTLRTLPTDELRSGLGEVLKHGLLGDPELFAMAEAQTDAILGLHGPTLVDLVVRNCKVKAAVVAQDEREAGLRAVLNLGHTVGHAIETAVGHGSLRHGECVALGLIAETAWSAARGECAADLPTRVRAAVAGLGLPTRPPEVSRQSLHDAVLVDKKRSHGTIRTAVVQEIGRVRLDRVPLAQIPDMFRAFEPQGALTPPS